MDIGIYPKLDKISAAKFFAILHKEKEPNSLFRFPVTKAFAVKAWEKLYAEYVAEFGAPKAYVNLLKHLLVMSSYYHQSLKKKPFIAKARSKVNELKVKIEAMEGMPTQSVYDISAVISSSLGFTVNPEKISARQFFSYLKMIEKDQK